MTEKEKEKLLSRATPEYARAYLDKLGEKAFEMSNEELLIGFVHEVIQPRENEKGKSGHH